LTLKAFLCHFWPKNAFFIGRAMPKQPRKRHFIDFIVEDDEIDASVRTYRVPEAKAQALLQLMDEYLVERVPTGRRPAYEDDAPPEMFHNPIPEGVTKRHGGDALSWARLE
jgi:hypothetical protein